MVNFTPPPDRQQDSSFPSALEQRIDAWRDLLGKCASKPRAKYVHALRSMTLRLQAILGQIMEQILQQVPDQVLEHARPRGVHSGSAIRAFKRWSKEGKKLRRMLQPVRDADVFLARLNSLRGIKAEESNPDSQLSLRCLREIGDLQCLLEQEREKRSAKLITTLNGSSERLFRLSSEMETALKSHFVQRAFPDPRAASELFAVLSDDHTHLDRSNLHDYRKRLKQALYLSEIAAEAVPDSAQLVAELRKMQDAVGEWHDWQALALKARRKLSAHKKQDGLVSVLEAKAEETIKIALDRCQHAAVNQVREIREIAQSPGKKPVASVPAPHHDNKSIFMRVVS
jgi:CHAD domain-containing protein